ncbi:MAG: NAD(P)(+) transhydrogenase (Re/Si-specific) subunit beta [Armatimonadota bacterium]
MPKPLLDFVYLVAAVLFIMGLKGLAHPRTAPRGNLLSAVAMLLAVVVTLIDSALDFRIIAAGLAVGAAIGWIAAVRVQMTSMPEMVAIFNGVGGLASLLVAGGALLLGPAASGQEAETAPAFFIAVVASGLVGAVTFSGSMVAWGKLQGVKYLPDGAIMPGQQALNGVLLAASVALGAFIVVAPGAAVPVYGLICLLALILGVTLTQPIGGADMPVVIALLNSYSGIAAAMTGFVIQNNVLIISGSLVGASGIILCQIMCRAMNRSLPNVMFGRMGAGGTIASADEVYGGKVKATSVDELALLLDGVQRVVIIPGYGMAVSQAQHAVRDLTHLLEGRGVAVEFGIHPVAGRMPGHMNVLLAEVNIPYEKLKDMDEINASIEQADVAIVLGANDVVNPDARTNPNSPIAGMPIIDVDKARTVVVVKRSLSPGFAGIPNPLFAAENSLMLFADGKKAVVDLISALKEG